MRLAEQQFPLSDAEKFGEEVSSHHLLAVKGTSAPPIAVLLRLSRSLCKRGMKTPQPDHSVHRSARVRKTQHHRPASTGCPVPPRTASRKMIRRRRTRLIKLHTRTFRFTVAQNPR